ncbi:hypothetical protein GOA89_11490 [Sinorhizobium meliloti]|nr:hypothetical protein [Sinorhizobium meliloti]MDW9846925.1 hypothetical protein [Sinorhizobium meliloti]MDX0143729.1 hypothetical protein [Sinorhizobium meliloti]MDX0149754.1 hypothetical protein [Sinorhizobium meliloti]MDX0168971.1 hypothetical protein [Sinorhizobium meliloti]
MKEFRFVQAENGGWVVFIPSSPEVPPPVKAAFSSTEDLTANFTQLLQPASDGIDPVTMQQGDV